MKRKRMKSWIVIGFITIVIGIYLINTNSDIEIEATIAKREQSERQQEANKESYKNLVLEFEEDIYSIEDRAKPALENYLEAMQDLSEGKITVKDAYSAATEAQEAIEEVKGVFYILDVPDNLPEDIKDLLALSVERFSTAYYNRENAVDYALEFLDDQDPVNLQKFIDENNAADDLVSEGVISLAEAKEQLE